MGKIIKYSDAPSHWKPIFMEWFPHSRAYGCFFGHREEQIAAGGLLRPAVIITITWHVWGSPGDGGRRWLMWTSVWCVAWQQGTTTTACGGQSILAVAQPGTDGSAVGGILCCLSLLLESLDILADTPVGNTRRHPNAGQRSWQRHDLFPMLDPVWTQGCATSIAIFFGDMTWLADTVSVLVVIGIRCTAICLLDMHVTEYSHQTHDIVATLNQRHWRWFNVATTPCVQRVTRSNSIYFIGILSPRTSFCYCRLPCIF